MAALLPDERAKRKALRTAETQKRQAERAQVFAEEKVKVLSEKKKRAKGCRERAKEARKSSVVSQELARRELSRRKMLPFIMRFNPGYMPGWVHKDICERLEQFSQDVVDKKSPRLLLTMPPRHGKSTLASIGFPAWHLGRNPTHEIIACSYAGSLAMTFSRKVRAMARERLYQQTFADMRLDPDNQSAENWMTKKGGGYVAAGVGGGITGRGAHILLIDDPVKNREDAESETTRQSNKDWYTSTAYTRLAPGGGVLMILTRWHDDDLAGWQLALGEKGHGDDWEVVNYPAIAEEDEPYRKKGDPLHPVRYDLKQLKQIERAVGPRDWSALYQQKPVADDGDYFTRSMFQYYDGSPPIGLRTYAAWDLAIGKKERNDFTVGITVGVDVKGDIYLLDLIRGKWDSLEITEQILNSYVKWKPAIVGIEKEKVAMAIGPFLNKRIEERKLHEIALEDFPIGRRDKELRARAIQGRMQQGKVYLPKVSSWVGILEYELLRFPNGVHDDCVDSLAWIGLMLANMVAHTAPKAKKRKSWKDKLKAHMGNKQSSAMAA